MRGSRHGLCVKTTWCKSVVFTPTLLLLSLLGPEHSQCEDLTALASIISFEFTGIKAHSSVTTISVTTDPEELKSSFFIFLTFYSYYLHTCSLCLSRQLRAGNHTHSNRHSHTNNLHLAPNLRTCRGQRKKSYSDRNSQRDPELPVAAACRPAWMNKGEKFV